MRDSFMKGDSGSICMPQLSEPRFLELKYLEPNFLKHTLLDLRLSRHYEYADRSI